MSSLVVRKNGENITYSGSQFEGLENLGTHHLCINHSGNTVKYGLTSIPLDDKYKALKMKIGNADGKYAYIAQKYNKTISEQSSTTYTSTNVSNYISSMTLTSASKSSLSTKTTTRASAYTSSQTLSTASKSSLSTKTTTRASTSGTNYYGSMFLTLTSTYPSFGAKTIYGKFISLSSSVNNYYTSLLGIISSQRGNSSKYTLTLENIYTINGSRVVNAYSVTRSSVVTRTSGYTSSQTLITASKSSLSTKATTRASTYTSSQTLTTASSSSLNTVNATSSYTYNTSSSVSLTKSTTTHNVDL